MFLEVEIWYNFIKYPNSNCQKPLFQIFGGVVLLCLHNANYPQFFNSKGVEAYFLAVCEIKAVYNKTSSEKPVKSTFLFLGIFKISEISQSLGVQLSISKSYILCLLDRYCTIYSLS